MSKVNIEYEKVFYDFYDCAYLSLEGYNEFQLTVVIDFSGFRLGLHIKDTPSTGQYSGSLETPWFEGSGGWEKPVKTEFSCSNNSIFLDFHTNSVNYPALKGQA